MSIILALASAFLTALYFVYASQTMKRLPGLPSTLTLTVSHLSAALLLLPAWLWRGWPFAVLPQSALWQPLLLTAGFLVLSRQLYFYAYAHTDVANITVFSALTPVYTVITGYVFLHETLSLRMLLGLLLICSSIYFFFLHQRTGESLAAALFQPFRAIRTSKPVFCAFLSTIPTAFAAIFQKQILYSLDPVSFSFLLLLLIGLAAGVITACTQPRGEALRQIRRLPMHFFFLSALLLSLMHVFFCLVMIQHQTAVSLVLQRTSILFQIVLAYVYLKERNSMRKRLIVTVFIIAGFGLIMAK